MGRTWTAAAALIAATTLLGACSMEDSFSDEPQSWACLRVKTMVDLTSSMPLSTARELLDVLVADTTLTPEETAYAVSLRAAVDDGDPTDELGDRLDGVPCTLA